MKATNTVLLSWLVALCGAESSWSNLRSAHASTRDPSYVTGLEIPAVLVLMGLLAGAIVSTNLRLSATSGPRLVARRTIGNAYMRSDADAALRKTSDTFILPAHTGNQSANALHAFAQVSSVFNNPRQVRSMPLSASPKLAESTIPTAAFLTVKDPESVPVLTDALVWRSAASMRPASASRPEPLEPTLEAVLLKRNDVAPECADTPLMYSASMVQRAPAALTRSVKSKRHSQRCKGVHFSPSTSFRADWTARPRCSEKDLSSSKSAQFAISAASKSAELTRAKQADRLSNDRRSEAADTSRRLSVSSSWSGTTSGPYAFGTRCSSLKNVAESVNSRRKSAKSSSANHARFDFLENRSLSAAMPFAPSMNSSRIIKRLVSRSSNASVCVRNNGCSSLGTSTTFSEESNAREMQQYQSFLYNSASRAWRRATNSNYFGAHRVTLCDSALSTTQRMMSADRVKDSRVSRLTSDILTLDCRDDSRLSPRSLRILANKAGYRHTVCGAQSSADGSHCTHEKTSQKSAKTIEEKNACSTDFDSSSSAPLSSSDAEGSAVVLRSTKRNNRRLLFGQSRASSKSACDSK